MLKTRVLVALVLIPAFLAALFYLPFPAWQGLMGALAVLAAREWAGLAGCGRGGQMGFMALMAIACWLLDRWTPGIHAVGVAVLSFWLIVAPLWLARHWMVRQRFLLLLVGLVVIAPTWLAFVALREISPALVLFLMGLVWIADSAAYGAGHRWGKHKLAPRISPGKTWEGVFGALAAVAVYVVLWRWLAPDALGRVSQLSFLTLFTSSLALVGISVLGDLFESHIKRTAGVKDSGTLIPGHGGLLDRIDSQTSVLPVTLAALHFIFV